MSKMYFIFTNPMTPFPYTIHPQLILRTPARPFENSLPDDIITRLLNDAVFLEAVYLASPVLYRGALKLKNGTVTDKKERQGIEISLLKYYQRMFSRSTPFGLFSGCGLTKWTETDAPVVLNGALTGRHTRLDMHYLCALAQRLAEIPFIRERLRWYPNNSCYNTPSETRYVEYQYHEGRRQHQVSALGRTEYLEEVLEAAKPGITLNQVKQLLVKDDITEAEADEYIEALLQSQVLVSSLEPAITGQEFMHQILQGLEHINTPVHDGITALIASLRRLQAATEALDAGAGNTVEAYLNIMNLAGSLEVPFEENKLFQTDLVLPETAGGLPAQYRTVMEAAVQALFMLTVFRPNQHIDAFITRFRDRYEDREMPLLMVLDGETGIGYPQNAGQSPSDLAGHLFLEPAGERKQEIQWDEKQGWLLSKLDEALRERRYEVELTGDDLKNLKPDWKDMPPSFSVMFRVAAGGDVVIDNCGGGSAAALPGRFAYGDAAITKLVTDITTAEQEKNSGVVFAEIVHLPESRIGNILLHPQFREYEIPYLAAASVPEACRIQPGDIYISVKNNRIVLRCGRLNREVIPRLSSAHNFSYNSLPVYRFLCDLQTQQLRAAAPFNWGPLAGHFRFLPRVRYGRAILHEATWQLGKTELDIFIKALRLQDFTEIKAWQMPRLLTLADGDNELLLDTASKTSVEVFLSTVKNRPAVTLKEFLYAPEGAVQNRQGNPYISQFIASFIKNETVYEPAVFEQAPQAERVFAPGSEWLYYKIYCGVHASEQLLTEELYPLIRELMEAGLVTKWFFIRFADPDFHLRLRLRLTQPQHTGAVMARLNELLQPLRRQAIIWRLQTDTYQRELERYGDELVQAAEQLFYLDSEIKIKFLQQTGGDERERYRWPWAMRQADWLLDCFGYSHDEKAQLMKAVKENFAAEFKMHKGVLQQMNKKYGASRRLMEAAMLEQPEADETAAALSGIFHGFTEPVKAVAANIIQAAGRERLNGLTGSYLHMSLNRIFPDRPRQQEAVLYDYLYKWYISRKYINGRREGQDAADTGGGAE